MHSLGSVLFQLKKAYRPKALLSDCFCVLTCEYNNRRLSRVRVRHICKVLKLTLSGLAAVYRSYLCIMGFLGEEVPLVKPSRGYCSLRGN